MIIEKIKKIVKDAVKEKFDIEMNNIEIEHPADMEFGDYSVNIAFKLSGHLNKKPAEIAEEIVNEIQKSNKKEIEKVETAGGGFINFYLSPSFFKDKIDEIIKEKKKWGRSDYFKNKKVVVEYTDPNPFKEFHIGHLMSNTIGESVSRIVEFGGADVKRVNYQGDVGLHVAKAIWGLLNSNLKSNKIKDLGEAYAKGAEAYEKSDKFQKEINNINKKVYEIADKKINSIYKKGKKTSLKYFEKIYKKLGTKFDRYFFESEVAGVGKKIVEDNLKVGIFEESEGAIVFKGEPYGLHTRVFISSEGLPTYEAKELGLSEVKDSEFSPDKSIILTGNEVEEYFKVVKKAMEFINPSVASSILHIPHGMMKMETGKISSRKGGVPTANELIEKVSKSAGEKIKRGTKNIAEKIGIGAIKYSILKRSTGKDAIFDIDKALSFEGDSGAYLQYSYTRAVSILKNAKKARIKRKDIKKPKKIGELERILYKFPEVMEEACEKLEPKYVTNYLTELSSAFNSFYAREKIVDKNDNKSPYNVSLVEAFSITLKNGLWVLGIETPEKM